jgi:hypothetical protein
MTQLARFLVVLGVVFLLAGGLVYFAGRLGINFGRLPGDIRVSGGNATCVIALGTSILLSIILTIALNIFARLVK